MKGQLYRYFLFTDERGRGWNWFRMFIYPNCRN